METAVTLSRTPHVGREARQLLIGTAICAAAVALLPFAVNAYWVHIAALAFIYWVLIAGLNLVVGYAGQLAIGFVGLLATGAYTAAILCEKFGLNAFIGLAAGGVTGAMFGFLVGLPSLRLQTFYFAMTTLGFATIVAQVALGWESLTGGGIGLPGPVFPQPFDSPVGFYALCFVVAAFATYLLRNIATSNFGRGLVAMRDADVAAQAVGVPLARLKLTTFTFSGALAGVSGGLFATRQSYITPDAFTFDLSVLFFIAVLIGGKGRIVGPMIGTVILTLLPEFAAPLVAWSTFAYAALLLIVVLAMPGGIAAFGEKWLSKKGSVPGIGEPKPELLDSILGSSTRAEGLSIVDAELSFRGVRALGGISLDVRPGTVHGLIGPNGSGKTTALNVVSGFYRMDRGRVGLGEQDLSTSGAEGRAAFGLARSFQTPRVVGNLSILENAMLGAYSQFRTGFYATALGSLRAAREDRAIRTRAMTALEAVGLGGLAERRAEELQHTGQRLLEIARCLVMQPKVVLFDEPAAGLSAIEIEYLYQIIDRIRSNGVSVLLVEHHTDLVFRVSDDVTVFNLGRVLATGTPQDVRRDPEVIRAYLGS